MITRHFTTCHRHDIRTWHWRTQSFEVHCDGQVAVWPCSAVMRYSCAAINNRRRQRRRPSNDWLTHESHDWPDSRESRSAALLSTKLSGHQTMRQAVSNTPCGPLVWPCHHHYDHAICTGSIDTKISICTVLDKNYVVTRLGNVEGQITGRFSLATLMNDDGFKISHSQIIFLLISLTPASREPYLIS